MSEPDQTFSQFLWHDDLSYCMARRLPTDHSLLEHQTVQRLVELELLLLETGQLLFYSMAP